MSKIEQRKSKIRRDTLFFLENKSYEDDSSTVEGSTINSLEIKKTRCCRIIVDSKDTTLCSCGIPVQQHQSDVLRQKHSITTWSIDNCTEENGLTDAYGELEFIDNGDKLAKYIRVHHRTEMRKMLSVLFDYWKLSEPKLLISVTGGAQRFNLSPRLQECFRKGLIKAAASTDAWISTGGLNVGVMRHVGEAIHENPNDKVVVLGIATWTMVLDNHKLINSELNNRDEMIQYSLGPLKKGIKKQYLDPNHTHFILVDNAKHSYGGEIEFRAELESAISKRNKINPVPTVQLVLEGGPGTLDTVANAINKQIPCVFVEGSGKCADLFAFALKEIEKVKKDGRWNIDNSLEQELLKRIDALGGQENREKLLGQVKKTIDTSNSHLLSVFDIDKSDDIDIAILTSLLKAKRDNRLQLKLSLNWNRVDIARDYIFKDHESIDSEVKNEIMYEAIVQDRVEFVRLILENGFHLKDFLTWRRLLKLYNNTLESSRLFSSYITKVIHQDKDVFDFKDIGCTMEHLTNHLYQNKFNDYDFSFVQAQKTLENTDDWGNARPGVVQLEYSVVGPHNGIDINEKCDKPEHELFLLCVLNTRCDMAKVFWEKGHNEVSSALMASKLLKKYASEYYEELDNLSELANEFEAMAVSVLNNCFESDEDRCETLILRKIPEFGHLNGFQIAAAADCKKFIAHTCCQRLLTKLWYNKLSPDNSKLRIAPCFFLPFLAPLLLQYNETVIRKSILKYTEHTTTNGHLTNGKSTYKNQTFTPLTYFDRFHNFVQTPLVKFFYDQIFYVGFLLLFSYVILCDFFPISIAKSDYHENLGIRISPYECVLIIWVFSFTVHEIRQFLYSDSMMFKAKIRNFLTFWNVVDSFCLVFFYVALIFRFIPGSYECYLTARILFSLDIVMWYMKSLSFYSVIRNLGPKLVMIKQMLIELVYFISIVLVFMFAFGVSTQALMYHNQDLTSSLLKQVFFPSYFVIGGEYYTRDTIMDADTCEQRNNSLISDDVYTQDDCPDPVGADVSLALYTAYLIILNILLVNLLIAIFSYTFQKIQDETDYVWKYQRYSLVHEYCLKPKLPAPFSLLSYFVMLLRLCLRPIRRKLIGSKLKASETNVFKRFFWYLSKESFTGFNLNISKNEDRTIMKWEKYHTEDWLSRQRKEEKESEKFKLQEAIDKIDALKKKLKYLENDRREFNEKLDKIYSLIQNHVYDIQPLKIQ